MNLIELNALDNNSASAIMDKKILFGVLIETHETLEYRDKENTTYFFPLPSRVSLPNMYVCTYVYMYVWMYVCIGIQLIF